MADPQPQGPQVQPGQSVSSGNPVGGQDEAQGGGEPTQAAHWCYQCNKEVIAEAEADGGPDSMVCSECRSGFIEALATAQTVPDVRRAQRRRRRRATATAAIIAGASPGATARHMVPLSEALEHLYPQQLMQVLQLLGQATNRSNHTPPASQDEENPTTVQAPEVAEGQTPALPGEAITQNQSGLPSSVDTSREEASEGQEGRSDTPTEGEESGTTPSGEAAEALERITPEGHLMFIRDTSPSHDDDDGDDDLVGSDTESEEGMRLEFDAWDSADEEDDEEWEEVDEDEEAAETGAEDGAGEDNEAEVQEGEQPQEQNGEERQPRVREFRLRTRNMENNLHQYLQELLQNLVGQNIEVRVELPDGPLYVGNPGDYVDARGFEMLLQQMAENDTSRRGAPPAAKSAVECLPSISIEQRHVDDGSAVCAICKDVVAMGEPAKQLPCLHLYHQDCILPWLSSRNSCPVCRYELPTDDPDYEEQKQSRSGTVQNNSASPSPTSLTLVSEDGLQGNNTGGDQVADASGHQTNNRETRVDAVEPVGTSSSRNEVEPVASGQGEQDHQEGATELSFSQGSDTTNTNTPHSRNEGGERERGENESDEVERRDTLRGTGRGWFLLAAGPVLSMMGLVLVLCIGNHLIGGRMQHLGRPLQRQQHHFFQEPNIEQIGGGSEVQGRRRWWMPFQR